MHRGLRVWGDNIKLLRYECDTVVIVGNAKDAQKLLDIAATERTRHK